MLRGVDSFLDGERGVEEGIVIAQGAIGNVGSRELCRTRIGEMA